MTLDAETQRIVEGSDADFTEQVVEASKAFPVIAEFYAPWCDPCARLGPPLESAVRHAGREIALVKIDIDQNAALADRLFVTAIPALFVFKAGRPMEALAGVIGAHQIQAFVAEAQGPDQPSDLSARAAAKMDEGDYDAAVRLYAMLHFANPGDTAALAGVIRAYTGAGETHRAKATLASVGPTDAHIEGAAIALDLIDNAPSSIMPLMRAAEAAPDDPAAILAYAEGLAGFTRYGDAAELLLKRLKAERNDGAARRLLHKVMAAAGPESDLTRGVRQRLTDLQLS